MVFQLTMPETLGDSATATSGVKQLWEFRQWKWCSIMLYAYIYISLSIYISVYTHTHTVGDIYIYYTHRYPLLITSEARHSSCQEPPNRSNTWSSHETLCHQGHHLGHRSGNVTFAHDIFDSSTSLSILEWGNVNFTRCIFFLKPDSPTQFYLK